MPKTVISTLLEAGQGIADPARWTQGALARNKTGDPIKPTKRGAVKFCSIGIICAVTRWDLDDANEDWRVLNLAGECLATLDMSAQRLYRKTLNHVNENIGHADVLAIYRAAIRYARA